MSSAGRAPAAYPKVGRTQRRSASSASPTEPTPACRSVSPGMKAREYRRKVGGRKAAVRPRRDPWPQRRRTAQKRPLRRAAQPDRAARDGVAAAGHTTEREAHVIWRGRHLGLLRLAPPPQPGADVCRLEAEGLADSLEAERPLRGGRREPLLCLGEQSLAAARGRGHVLLEGADRVLEHGEHEPLLGLKGCVDLEAIEELRRKDGLGLQPRTSRLVEPSRCLRFHRCLLPLRCRRSRSRATRHSRPEQRSGTENAPATMKRRNET